MSTVVHAAVLLCKTTGVGPLPMLRREHCHKQYGRWLRAAYSLPSLRKILLRSPLTRR